MVVCAAGGQSTIVVNVPTVQLGNTAGQVPVHTMCPNCHNSVVTNLTYEIGGLTWLIFAILCFVGSVLCRLIGQKYMDAVAPRGFGG